MALWDKVKQELDRAGQVAQGAIEEGRLRLDALRARQLADKAAQAIGYAVYRARQTGSEVDADTYARLSSTLAGHEAEAKRLEDKLAEPGGGKRGAEHASASPDEPSTASPGPTSSSGSASSGGAESAAAQPPM